jgi:hypothetical protein
LALHSTFSVPRHAAAYSPRWDARLGLWTDTAVEARLNQRQIHENQVFNLAAARASAEHGARRWEEVRAISLAAVSPPHDCSSREARLRAIGEPRSQ